MNVEKTGGGHFRFPVGALGFAPGDGLRMLYGVLGYCAVELGVRLHDEYDDEELGEMVAVTDGRGMRPVGRRERLAFLGARSLGIERFSVGAFLGCHGEMAGYLAGVDEASGANTVNVVRRWVWDAIETARGRKQERTLSEREFRVLAALLSKIGTSKYAKCGWVEIQARAAGWCGKRAMRAATEAERARREPLILSREQIRGTLRRLETDRFFARVNHANHESWFSFSCVDNTELRAWVMGLKSRRGESWRRNRAADAEASEVVRRRRSGSPAPPEETAGGAMEWEADGVVFCDEKHPLEAPEGNHRATTINI